MKNCLIPDNTELPPCACSGSRSGQRQPLTSSERTFPRSCRRWHHRLPSHLCQLHSPHSPQQPLRDVPGLRPGVGVRQGTTCHGSRGRIGPAVGLLTRLAEAGPAPGWGVPVTLVSAPIKMEPAAVQGQTSGGRAPRPRQSQPALYPALPSRWPEPPSSPKGRIPDHKWEAGPAFLPSPSPRQTELIRFYDRRRAGQPGWMADGMQRSEEAVG